MADSNSIIGHRLKSCREQANESLEFVGALVGVNKSTVFRWENGDTGKINLPTLERLAEHFGVSPAWLAGKTDDPKPEIFKSVRLPNNIIPLPKTSRTIPLLGEIACGQPILADENYSEVVPVPDYIHADFALRCRGDSMVGARILDGDIVYIRQQPDVEDGEIAAVLIGDEATLKRVYKIPGRLQLRPENPSYSVMEYADSELDQVRILGRAVYFVSGVR